MRGEAHLRAGRGKCELAPAIRIAIASMIFPLGALAAVMCSDGIGETLVLKLQVRKDEVTPNESIPL